MSTTDALAAIEKALRVDASIETAFDTFVRRMTSWWPVETHSIYGDEVEELVFEERPGGRLYERTRDGREAVWADVVEWEPPRRIVLRWSVNPDRGPTEIEVRFTPEDDGTRVDLVHRGWDRIGDAEGRTAYDPGWDYVLGRYVQAMERG